MKLTKEQAFTLSTIQDSMERHATDLSALATELRDAWEEKFTKWQESEAGAHANDWIEEFENQAEALCEVEGEISGLENEDQS